MFITWTATYQVPILTPTIFSNPTDLGSIQGTTFAYVANTLLSTMDINMQNIKDWAILDSNETSHFLIKEAPAINVQPTLMPLNVSMPDGNQVSITHT